jgi:hypothetical protein
LEQEAASKTSNVPVAIPRSLTIMEFLLTQS